MILAEELYHAMVARALDVYPLEACGLLRGRHGRATAFLPAKNVAATPEMDYEVDAQSLLQALSWEDAGDELIAIFHSHPHSPAYPSAVDAARASYPESIYLILSLQSPDFPQLSGYFLRNEYLFSLQQTAELCQTLPLERVRPWLSSLYVAPDVDFAGLDPAIRPQHTAFYLICDEAPEPRLRLVSVRTAPIVIDLAGA